MFLAGLLALGLAASDPNAAASASAAATQSGVVSGPAREVLRSLAREAGYVIVFDGRRVPADLTLEIRRKPDPRESLDEAASTLGLAVEEIGPTTLVIKDREIYAPVGLKLDSPATSFPPLQDMVLVRATPALERRSEVPGGGIEVSDESLTLFSGLNIDQALAVLPQSTGYFSSANTSAAQSWGGVGLIDLRTLGPQRTAVRLNGKRLPQMPGHLGTVVTNDVSLVPESMIESVEIVDTTRGATVGADAVSGSFDLRARRLGSPSSARTQIGVHPESGSTTWMMAGMHSLDLRGSGTVMVGGELVGEDSIASEVLGSGSGDPLAADGGFINPIASGITRRPENRRGSLLFRASGNSGPDTTVYADVLYASQDIRSRSQQVTPPPVMANVARFDFDKSMLHAVAGFDHRNGNSSVLGHLRVGRARSQRQTRSSLLAINADSRDAELALADDAAITTREVEAEIETFRLFDEGPLPGLITSVGGRLSYANIGTETEDLREDLTGFLPSARFDGALSTAELFSRVYVPLVRTERWNMQASAAGRASMTTSTGWTDNADFWINTDYRDGIGLLMRYALSERAPNLGERYTFGAPVDVVLLRGCGGGQDDCEEDEGALPARSRFLGNPDIPPEKTETFRASLTLEWDKLVTGLPFTARTRATYSNYDIDNGYGVDEASSCLDAGQAAGLQCARTALEGMPRLFEDGAGIFQARALLLPFDHFRWEGLDFDAALSLPADIAGLERISLSALHTEILEFSDDGERLEGSGDYPESRTLFLGSLEWPTVDLGFQVSRLSSIAFRELDGVELERSEPYVVADLALRYAPRENVRFSIFARNITDNLPNPGIVQVSSRSSTNRFDYVGRQLAVEMEWQF
jgi:hypothetical protein